MISPTRSSLFCAIIIVANCGRIHCQDNPRGVSDVQQMRSGLPNEPDYLDQIFQFLSKLMGKLDTVDQRLIKNEKRQNDTENKSKNFSGLVETLLTELERRQSESEFKLATLTSSLHEIRGRTEVMEDSFAQTESPFVLDTTTLIKERGAIVFDGNVMSARKRRFWVIENAGTVKFKLHKNDLRADSRLTISGYKTTNYSDNQATADYLDEVYMNSSTANGTEVTVSGVVILVTMTCNETLGIGEKSSFVLRFLRSRNDTVFPPERTLYPSSFVTGEGRQVVSFPPDNSVDYENNANHFQLISRPSDREFNLTGTFMDTEKEKDFILVFQIKDEAGQTSIIAKWIISGKYGRRNWNYGRYSTAILFFTSNPSVTGKGYEFTIE